MKNLIMQLFDGFLSRNLERFLTPYRSYEDIVAYTVLEIMLLLILFVMAAMMVYYKVHDLKCAAKKRREREAQRFLRMAEADLEETQRRLLNELEFVATPCTEEYVTTAGEPEDFLEVFYHVCPELAPNFPH